jgi:hypothetical protein
MRMDRLLSRFLGALAVALVVATPAVAIAGAAAATPRPAPQGDLSKELEARLREAPRPHDGNLWRARRVADYVGQEFIDDFVADPDKIFTLDELNSYAIGRPARFTPGARRIYTNSNTNLLGAVGGSPRKADA